MYKKPWGKKFFYKDSSEKETPLFILWYTFFYNIEGHISYYQI